MVSILEKNVHILLNKTQFGSSERIRIFREIWKNDKNNLIRFVFFILDKTQINDYCLFLEYLNEIKNLDKISFYYNISHIIGKPNSKTFDKTVIEKAANNDYNHFTDILDKFVEPEFQNSFKINWLETTKNEVLSKTPLPVFGDVDTLVELYNIQKDDIRLKSIVVNLLKQQSLLDKNKGSFSEAYGLLEKHFPEENNIKSWEPLKHLKPLKHKHAENFQKRYMHLI
tara:strand:- start:368 stop:1048 length:681 start_codon:yes stop_codon:yes gene_type:complete